MTFEKFKDIVFFSTVGIWTMLIGLGIFFFPALLPYLAPSFVLVLGIELLLLRKVYEYLYRA